MIVKMGSKIWFQTNKYNNINNKFTIRLYVYSIKRLHIFSEHFLISSYDAKPTPLLVLVEKVFAFETMW